MMRSTALCLRPPRNAATRHRARLVSALVTVCLLPLTAAAVADAQPAARAVGTGFALPFSGAPAYEPLAPTEITAPGQLHQPLGERAADAIAVQTGLSRADVLTDRQYRALVTGGGVGGSRQAARMVDASAWILTNTVGRPLFSTVNGRVTPSVLASYGLYVNSSGMLQSPANATAPTREVNVLLAPGGYFGTWLRANGATRTLIALYRSAYTIQAAFGFACQQISGAAQLVTNTQGGVRTTVGMSMAPPLWIVNFILLYILKPSLAAAMPARWSPIPPVVARAIKASPTGQVPYADYARYLR